MGKKISAVNGFRKPKTEKIIQLILVVSSMTFFILTVLLFNGYKLKGIYSNPIIEILFIATTTLYFALTRFSIRKGIVLVILIPFILLSLIRLRFNGTLYESTIAEGYKIQVTTGRLMSCGELIYLIEAKLLMFDKEIVYESSLCLREIEKIETIQFNQDSAAFLIYHDGEMNSENPFKYKIENKDLW